MEISSISLLVHITSGTIALIVAILAIVLKKGTIFHRRLGRAYICAMSLVFISALHLSFIAVPINWFLFGIAIFSYYLAFTGFRAGKERKNLPSTIDWIATCVMLFSTVFMLVLGVQLLWNQNNLGVVLIIFGAVGGLLSVQDILQFRKGKIQGKERILRHLTRILASFIAVVTAVLVVNGAKLGIPDLVNWLAPSVIITPLIIYMGRSYKKTK